MIHTAQSDSRIRNLSLSALHLIAAETDCDVPYIIALLTEPRRGSGTLDNGAQTGPNTVQSPAGSDPVAIPAFLHPQPSEAGLPEVTASGSDTPRVDHHALDTADLDPTRTLLANCIECHARIYEGDAHSVIGPNEEFHCADCAPTITENAPDPAQAGESPTSPAPNQEPAPPPPMAVPASEPTGSDNVGGVASPQPAPPAAKSARRKGMAEQVVRVHREHPDWSRLQIAEELDCIPEYVDKAARRNGIILPAVPRGPNSGVTARIRQLHADHPDWTSAQIAHEVGRSTAQVITALNRAAAAEPAHASEPAAAPERRPQPKTPPAEPPRPSQALTGRSSPSVIVQKPVVKPKGTQFWLRTGNREGKYLHMSGYGLTDDKTYAWRGTEQQLLNLRQKFPDARDLIEQAIETEAAR